MVKRKHRSQGQWQDLIEQQARSELNGESMRKTMNSLTEDEHLR